MQRVQNITNYLKVEAPHLMPGVPNYLLHPLRWALGEVRASESLLDFEFAGFVNDNDMGSVVHPLQNFMQPAAAEDPQATWLASTYHHHNGFLPTHDAMMMGLHSRHDVLNDYMRFDMHPYLGQGYFSTHGYWGTDFSLDLASPSDTSRINKPWGKIVFGFSNGEDKLMDHGRGADLHGELRFNDHLTLNSGMRQSDTTGASNYVMLQWKLATE